jgi:tetratricopeptide (TPR) repeat protein
MLLVRSLPAALLLAASMLAQDADRIDKLLDQGFSDVAAGHFDPQIGREALRLSTDAQDRRRMARSLLLIATDNYYRTQLSEALERVHEAGPLSIAAGDIALQVQIKLLDGNVLRRTGRANEALTSLQECVALNRQLPQAQQLQFEGRIQRAIGTLYREMNDVVNADLAYRAAVKAAHESGDASAEAGSLLGLGATLKDRNRFQEAIPLHQQALAVTERAGLARQRGEVLNSLADIYTSLGQLDSASVTFQTALDLARATDYQTLEVQITERMGAVEMTRGHY